MADQKETYKATAKFTGFHGYPEDVTIVGIDCPNADCPELADDRVNDPLDRDKVESIKHHGVKEAIKVRRYRGDSRTFVVVGRGRVRAARAANEEQGLKGEFRHQIMAIPANDGDALTMMVIENGGGRKAPTPVQNAVMAQRMRERNIPEEKIASAFGVSLATLAGWKLIDGAGHEAHAAIEEGALTSEAAKEVAKVAPAKRAEAVAAARGKKGRAAVEAVKAVKAGKEPSEKSTKITTPQLRELVDLLGPTDDEPHGDGDSNLDLSWRLVRVILGESASLLKTYDDVQKLVRKAMKG